MTEPVDAAADVNVGGGHFTFYGQKLKAAEEVAESAVMEFAYRATEGETAESMEGTASLLRFVLELIDSSEHGKFWGLYRKNKPTSLDLMALVTQDTSGAAVPTDAPTESSDGRTPTELNSGPSSDGKDSPFAARPDLQLVQQMQATA